MEGKFKPLDWKYARDLVECPGLTESGAVEIHTYLANSSLTRNFVSKQAKTLGVDYSTTSISALQELVATACTVAEKVGDRITRDDLSHFQKTWAGLLNHFKIEHQTKKAYEDMCARIEGYSEQPQLQQQQQQQQPSTAATGLSAAAARGASGTIFTSRTQIPEEFSFWTCVIAALITITPTTCSDSLGVVVDSTLAFECCIVPAHYAPRAIRILWDLWIVLHAMFGVGPRSARLAIRMAIQNVETDYGGEIPDVYIRPPPKHPEIMAHFASKPHAFSPGIPQAHNNPRVRR